jgi:hypothetical protein
VATAEEMAAAWRGLRRSDIFPLRPGTLISGLAGRHDNLITGRAPRRLAARHLQLRRLEQACLYAPGHCRWSCMSCPEGLGAWLGADGPEAVLAQTGGGRAGVLEQLVTHFPSSRSDRQQPQW